MFGSAALGSCLCSQEIADIPQHSDSRCKSAKVSGGFASAKPANGIINLATNEESLDVQSSQDIEGASGSEPDDERSEELSSGEDGDPASGSEGDDGEDGSDETEEDDSDSSDILEGGEDIHDMEINTACDLTNEHSEGGKSAAELEARWGHLKGVRIVNDLGSDGATLAQVHGLLRTQRYHDNDVTQPFKVSMTITRYAATDFPGRVLCSLLCNGFGVVASMFCWYFWFRKGVRRRIRYAYCVTQSRAA
jgi:hypothetical protein